MGRLQRIKDAISGALPNFTNAIFPNRGLAYPLDPTGSGRPRFARLLGDTPPCMFAENASQLTQSLQQNHTLAIFDESIPWIIEGSMLRFPATGELLFAGDTYENATQVRFQNPAIGEYAPGDTLELFAHPTTFESYADIDTLQTGTAAALTEKRTDRVTVTGLAGMTAASVGRVLSLAGAANAANNGLFEILAVLSPTSVQIATTDAVVPDANNGALLWEEGYPVYSITSTQPIYPGDLFWRAYQEYEVRNSRIVGPVPPDVTRYLVTLQRLLPYVPPQDTLYLRAYPAYLSRVLPVPEVPFAKDTNGPGLLDWMSGPVLTDLDVQEVQHIKVYDGTLTTVIQDWTRIEKNHVELRRPIAADAFLFFTPTQGTINWNGTEWYTKANSEGQFHAFYTNVPVLPAGPVPIPGDDLRDGQVQSWRFQATPSAETRLVLELEPNARQVVTLPGGVTTSVTVNVPVGPITRMHIAYRTDPGATVRFGAWVPNTRAVEGIQHVLIARHTGRWDWASTTLFYKPYWLRLEYLKVYLDRRDRLDGGLLLL